VPKQAAVPGAGLAAAIGALAEPGTNGGP